jgi:eukaryotic-like serine/threonine-protein kinase
VSESEADRSFPALLQTGSMLKVAADLVEDAPRRLGPYRILERIGEGGMGIVYLAEQDAPLARRVAIKLARSAVVGDRALARFESERQTLASMNHPNIARVFDAGTARGSRPYFVMEHVPGAPITEFCDARKLGIEPRLELLVRVCDGVQHAHVNAIIHRDLKPSNILVTIEGGRPAPKIIDFGVAKALSDPAVPGTTLTHAGQVLGTPEYMSPEQAALDGRPVDTRTDVYALGVVLYELLVGRRPFECRPGPEDSLVALFARIREAEPERPSVVAGRAREGEVAHARGTTPRALARTLHSDLDAIAMKALAKDRAHRYATPAELAADLERYLEHRPILARRPGALHRLRKVVRRHRAAAATITFLALSLVGFASLGVAQALRAQHEAVRAETEAEVAADVRDILLAVIVPPRPLVTLEENRSHTDDPLKRDQLLQRIRERFSDQPVLLGQVLFAVGSSLFESSEGTRGFDLLMKEARGHIVSNLGADDPLAIETGEKFARTLMYNTRYGEAEPLLLDALERRRRISGADHPDTWRTTALLAHLYKLRNSHEQAVPLFESAVAGLERRSGPDDPDVLSSKVGLSGSYLELGRFAAARALLSPVVDRIAAVFGDGNWQTHVAYYNLACALAKSGRIDEAFAALDTSLERGWTFPLWRDGFLIPLRGDRRFDGLARVARFNFRPFWEDRFFQAKLLLSSGRLDEAERLFSDLIAAGARVEGITSRRRMFSLQVNLATCWIRRGRFEDAERLLLSALTTARAEESRLNAQQSILEALAQCDIGRGRRASALDRIAAAAANNHPVYEAAERLYAAAESEALQGQPEEALRTLTRAAESGFDDPDRLENDLAFRGLKGRPEFSEIARSVRRGAGFVVR